MSNPSVYIGSSAEGIEFARAIGGILAPVAEITLSNEGFFSSTNASVETLVNSLPRFDFAVLVLTLGDLISRGTDGSLGLRDDDLFELGLFVGRIGKARTFVVYPNSATGKVPSDLSGVTIAGYDWPRPDGSPQAAVASAGDSIRRAIRDLGSPETRLERQLQAVVAEQKRQREQIDDISYLLVHFISQYEWEHLRSLAGDGDFPFEMHPTFEQEIEHLWELHFITKTHEFALHHMPRVGDLRDYFKISDKGRTYLKLREGYAPDEWPAAGAREI